MKQDTEPNSDPKAQNTECVPLVEVLHCAGVNHRTAPLQIREKLSIPKEKLNEFLESLVKKLELQELVALSTCNRTEFYWASTFSQDQEQKQICPRDFFRALPLADPEVIAGLSPLVYSYRGKEAANHLFEVTSGLDSMVIGETQVSGQVKAAYEFSREKNLTGIALNFLFQKAFETTKKVHTQTALLSQKASIPAVALEFARAIFADLSDTFVLVIGTGEIAEVTMQVLAERGAKKVAVLTRSGDRAREFAASCQTQEVFTFDRLPDLLGKADIVIACTSATKPLITAQGLNQARAARKRNRPLLILDLGIPRNVSPEVSRLAQVYLRDLDSLKEIVEQNKEQLQAEVIKARRIIETGVSDYLHFCRAATASETIAELRAYAGEIARKELERTLGKMPELTDGQKAQLQELTHRILAKLLHNPSERLRFLSRNPQDQDAIQWARILFGLDKPDVLKPGN